MSGEWVRAESSLDARMAMLDAERLGKYELAALHALTLSDKASADTAESAILAQHAAVYAALHQAQTALFIAEHRQPFQLPDYQS